MPVRKRTSQTIRAQILMVDENTHGLTARKTVLEEQGHTVTTTKTRQQAIELFETHSYDLVITDHKMPRMNGLELIATLRAAQPAIRVILLSGLVEDLGLTAQSTGADAVIQKSALEAPQLIRVVARTLATKAVNRKSATSEPGSPKSKSHSA
jgi:CheY-like chemotaxis protein